MNTKSEQTGRTVDVNSWQIDIDQGFKLNRSWTVANVWVWGDRDSDAFIRNEARAFANGHEPCQFCGRGVNTAAGKGFLVHPVFGGGVLLAAAEWEEFDSYCYGEMQVQFPEDCKRLAAGDLGYFAIGPECGKHVPEAFKRKGEMP